MIQTGEGLELVHEQLGRAERALASLRATVLPLNKARYELMAEAYVEQILKLRAEIDAYLGIDAASSGVREIIREVEPPEERDDRPSKPAQRSRPLRT